MKLPLGGWAAERKQKEIGAYTALCIEHGYEALGMALLTRVLHMSVAEAGELIRAARKESQNRQIHGYHTQYDSLSLFPSLPSPPPRLLSSAK
jgi:Glu-tRNA(Gln) amidotransferase subunit E-like FAD-binding protein